MGGQRLLLVCQRLPVPASNLGVRGQVVQGPAFPLVVADGTGRGERLPEVGRGRVEIFVLQAVAEAVEGRTLPDAVTDLPVQREGTLTVLERLAVLAQHDVPPRETVPCCGLEKPVSLPAGDLQETAVDGQRVGAPRTIAQIHRQDLAQLAELRRPPATVQLDDHGDGGGPLGVEPPEGIAG
jgi:hypothetical protein